MRWPVVLVVAYLLIGIEAVVPRELAVGPTSIAPSFILPFIVFVAMFAPAMKAYWTALLCGLAIDLLSPRGAMLVVPGPYALGFLAAAFLIVTIRTIINRNTVAVVVFSMLGTAIAQIVIVALLTFRSMYTDQDVMVWSPTQELVQRMLASLYTGVTAFGLSFLLFPMLKTFGFADPYSRRSGYAGL